MNFKQFFNEALASFGGFSQEEIKKLDQLTNNLNVPFCLHWNGRVIDFSLGDCHDLISINPKTKEINLPQDYEYSPYETSAIENLYRTNLFNDFRAKTAEGIFILSDLVKKIKPIVGKYETWANLKYDFRSAIKPFAIKVIKEITDRKFYHATFKKYLGLIKKEGLKPSRIFGDVEDELIRTGQIKAGEGVPLGMIAQHGWSSSLNPEKQRAVYFFLDKSKAENLANYLNYRNDEPTVVLEVDGKALSDYSKIIVDEDALRDDSGASKSLKTQLPHFYTSALSIRTIAYKGTILPEYIRAVSEYNKKITQD